MKWKRPTGTIIETNDLPATIARCEAMGWKRYTPRPPNKKKVAKKKSKGK